MTLALVFESRSALYNEIVEWGAGRGGSWLIPARPVPLHLDAPTRACCTIAFIRGVSVCWREMQTCKMERGRESCPKVGWDIFSHLQSRCHVRNALLKTSVPYTATVSALAVPSARFACHGEDKAILHEKCFCRHQRGRFFPSVPLMLWLKAPCIDPFAYC